MRRSEEPPPPTPCTLTSCCRRLRQLPYTELPNTFAFLAPTAITTAAADRNATESVRVHQDRPPTLSKLNPLPTQGNQQ